MFLVTVPSLFEVLDEELGMRSKVCISFRTDLIKHLDTLVFQVKTDRIVVTTLIVSVVWCKLLEHGEHDLHLKK